MWVAKVIDPLALTSWNQDCKVNKVVIFNLYIHIINYKSLVSSTSRNIEYLHGLQIRHAQVACLPHGFAHVLM